MSNNNLVASQDDYVKFKKLLQFFVWQSNRNADNGRAERPTRNKSQESDQNNPEFIERYGLESDFNKMAKKLDFIIRFFMCGRFNTELSTYINIGLLNIIGKFEKGKIVALRNLIRLDIPSISILGDLRKRCEERNEQLNYYSLEELGIEKDCPSEKISEALKSVKDANDSLKKMFDEYLGIYNEFYEPLKSSINRKNTIEKYEEATKLYEEDKDKAFAYYYDFGNELSELAKINKDKNLFKKAFEKYDKAIQLDPKNAYVFNRLGTAFYNLAKINKDKSLFKNAFEKYEEAAQLYETNEDKAIIFNNYGTALYELAEIEQDCVLFERAIEKYKKATQLDPSNASAYYNCGIVLYDLAEYKKNENLYKEAVECFIESKQDILSIFVALYTDNKKRIFQTKYFYPLLDSLEFFTKITESIKEDKIKFNEYKDIYLISTFIISLLYINNENENEKFVAHYREKDISQKLLFDSNSKFRLNAINYSNDPTEGKTLLEFLYGKEKLYEKEKLPSDEELNTEFEAFAGCFTFNYDSLNQFRLYGKEDGKEGTGLSLVFRNNFFSKEAKMAFEPPETDSDNVNNDYLAEKEKFALFRCIYIDPHPETKQPVVAVGRKEEYLFYREDKGGDFKGYNDKMEDIIGYIRDKMDTLKKQAGKLNPKIVGQLLLNLRYLVKHVAFKEEQECRIVNIRHIQDKDINMKPEYKQIYINYLSKVSDYIAEIYFGPKATGFELFKSILKNRTLNKKIPCEKSTNPLA